MNVRKVSQVRNPWGIKLAKAWKANPTKCMQMLMYFVELLDQTETPMTELELSRLRLMQTGLMDRAIVHPH